MRFGIVLAALAVCGAASLVLPAPARAAVASSPARGVSAPGPDIVQVQSSGTTKIRKECEAKADKQKLKGVTHQGYVEQCMAALSFNTTYGTNTK
ncbi:MAG: hypothetical protein ACYC1L_15220 [Alphaproteobacteria bacterium]